MAPWFAFFSDYRDLTVSIPHGHRSDFVFSRSLQHMVQSGVCPAQFFKGRPVIPAASFGTSIDCGLQFFTSAPLRCLANLDES